MTTETKLPGLKSAHTKITPTCRVNRGVGGAFDEAVRQIRGAYDQYAVARNNAEVTWHLVLIRDDGE